MSVQWRGGDGSEVEGEKLGIVMQNKYLCKSLSCINNSQLNDIAKELGF